MHVSWNTVIIFSALILGTSSLVVPVGSHRAHADPMPAGEVGTLPRHWWILGPIPVFEGEPDPADQATQKAAFDRDFLQSYGGESGITPDLETPLDIGGTSYAWKEVTSEEDTVNLRQACAEREYVLAYAWTTFEFPEARSVLLGVGSDDGIKVWVNGKLVHRNWIGRPLTRDEDVVPIELKRGTNTILLKVQNMSADWGFSCRILDTTALTERLLQAAYRGNLSDIERLLTYGADPNGQKYGLTPLHMARIAGREEAVQFLLEHGADAAIPMPEPQQVIEARMKALVKDDGPGVALLVAKDGQVLYQAGFGYADIEHRIPVNPATKFRIGSITKQFTAAAILKLQEEGKLSVRDPLSKFIPDFPRGDEVTIHHLLNHTSGIHSFTNQQDFMEHVTEPIAPEAMVERIKQFPYDFDPGEQWMYNNSGYFLLGVIVAQVTGKSFGEALREMFFDPLGMKDTGIHASDLELENEALGYSYEGGKIQRAIDWDMSRAGGAGALYSTVGDLYRWNEAIFNGKVLSQESLEAAWTPTRLNDGSVADALGGQYGYGWMLGSHRGLRVVAHGGGLQGFSSYLARYPEQHLTVAVLSNCLPPPPDVVPAAIAQEVAELYLWEDMEKQETVRVAEISSELYDDYVGRYAYPQSAVLTVTREGDHLYAQLSGQPRFEIFPKAKDVFFWKVVDAEVTFVRDEQGNVTHAIHRQGGAEFEAPKIQEEPIAPIDPAIYDTYVGEYELAPLGTLTITREGEHLYAQLTGQPRFEIFPRSETEFAFKVVQATITFVKDDQGKVNKLILEQAGMKFEALRSEGSAGREP